MNAPYKNLAVGAALLAATLSLHAQDGMEPRRVGALPGDVTGEISIGTDYRFRGISQTNRSFTVQGGLEYGHPSGLYFGVWGSNVDFSGGALELDPYVGFATEIAPDVDLDVGIIYFAYPKDGASPGLDFWEVYTSVAWRGLSFRLDYSPDYFAETGRFFYLHGGYDFELPGEWGLGFHLGSNMFKNSSNMDTFLELDGTGVSAGSSYLDWSVTLTKEAYGLDWSLAYVDTDLKRRECFAGEKLCSATVVFSVGKSL